MPGFTVGGTIQIIVNNLIGFTADPEECYSSRFSSDIGKRLPIPIFHVNGEDTEAAIRVAALAIEYRYTFHTDVIIDLVGYRRHGHSEVDDPTITQPLRYEKIKNHPPLYEIYGRQIGVDPSPRVKEIQTALAEAQKQATRMGKRAVLATLPAYWSNYTGGPYKSEYEVDTGLSAAKVEEISNSLTTYPRQFHIHPKIKKLLEQRREMGRGERLFDYGMAEALAFGSLLLAGTPVRLSGQDSQRGTFNQRHSVLVDIENEQLYFPLANLAPDQARFEVYNSMLSEAGVLGFEYGYSRDYPEALVLWEAQFGDFANGAQIIIDQFIASGEGKWGLLGGVVMLLPHGYEGQGPEHSSARLERYLQLAAHDNIQICQPSTAAQYFHLLRRQAMRAMAQAADCIHAQEHAAESRLRVRPWPASSCRASRMFCRKQRCRQSSVCCCARARSVTSCASNGRSTRTAPPASSSWNSCIPGRRRNWRPKSPAIPKRAKSFGCRKSRTIWGRSPL